MGSILLRANIAFRSWQGVEIRAQPIRLADVWGALATEVGFALMAERPWLAESLTMHEMRLYQVELRHGLLARGSSEARLVPT